MTTKLLTAVLLLTAAPSALASETAPPTGSARTAEATEDAPADQVDGGLVVTARRQAERAQDVPIALSVATGDSLERTGGFSLPDIQARVPSLTAFNSNPRNSSIGIRGIGVSTASDGLDTSTGVYIDGVYLGRPGMALADLIDVERVEVLRGPQGTLFGRNNSAGVLNITTRRPEFEFGALVEGSIGDYSYNQQRISITGPLVDGLLAARITAWNTHRDGVLDNIKTGISANSIGRSGARLQFLLTPSPDVSVRLIGDYSVQDDTCCVGTTKLVLPGSVGATTRRTLQSLAALGYVPQATSEYTQNNAPQNMLTDQKAVSLQVDWTLPFATFTSISAWRYWHFHPLQDSDGTPLDIIQVNVAQTKTDQYSQELRLASNPGRFNWQVGAFFYRMDLQDHFILNQFGYDASAFYTTYLRTANPAAASVNIAPGSQYIDDVETYTTSVAGFGQSNWEIVDGLTLTGGIRYTSDKRAGTSVTSTRGTPYAATSIPFNYDVEVEDDNVSYLLSAAWKPAADVLAYASYSTGYKGSGLNLNSAVSAGTPLVLDPETVKNWEAGLKTQWLNGRLTFNLSAFWTELSGLQANVVPTNGNRSYLANVGDVRSRGVEFDAALNLGSGLSIIANGSYNDARYTDYRNAPCPVGVSGVCDLTGERLFQAPEWVGNAIVEQRFELANGMAPYLIGQVSYRSEVFGVVDAGPYTVIPGYALVNFRLGTTFSDGRFDLSAFVNNVTDKVYYQNLSTSSIVGAAAFAYAGQLGAPRTIGATLRARF